MFLKLLDFGKKYRIIQSRVKFLRECQKFHVLPPTLHHIHKPAVPHASRVQSQVQLVQRQAGKSLLKIAISETVEDLKVSKETYRTSLDEVLMVTEDVKVKETIKVRIGSLLDIHFKSCANSHRQRLRNLLVRDSQLVPEVLSQSVTLPIDSFLVHSPVRGSEPDVSIKTKFPLHSNQPP